MATLDDLRRIAADLPGTVVADDGQFAISVPVKGKLKGFVWAWAERVDPRKARVINESVVAIVVPSLSAKEVIVASLGEAAVEDPHYRGYPAVLVRLALISGEDLEDLVIDAWRCKAPKDLLVSYDTLEVFAD
ncbi:MAG: hypothetical protein ACAH95_10410 [Fimbriimonas sp.]